MIALFPHNERAYQAAAALLEKTGRAAVIHPTGTGKSFIAFRLCEEHPAASVCWLSPSEYIYKTQVENLTATGADAPGNVTFLTYTRLMRMDEADIDALQADYVVLDEFHRCGAELWGRGVRRLLDGHPHAQVLGLSATNIRYLDNRRDMAEELFGGCIASEMTLGEAIVRGILRAPKYVLSVYSYEKDFARYERKLRWTGSRVVRARAQGTIDALRRALDRADALPQVFARHMEDPSGKYIVFCAGAEHMRRMQEKAAEWFGGVNASLHLYTAYSDDPGTDAAFAAFKADESPSLKLLYCIDMLNEGVHVNGVSGVILLRPTVSPIIYKQQIGRALTANGKEHPVIFDVVLNIENLNSIGTVEEEMETAAAQMRGQGMASDIRQQRFEIVDEVKDCRALFGKLDRVLAASWELMYEQAAAYYAAHGDLEVPHWYKTEEGYSLGQWIAAQRSCRKEPEGLRPEQIDRLDAIGMRWENQRELAWERHYAAAKRYFEENGHLNVPVRYVTEDGVHLGSWLSNLRVRQSAEGRRPLREERVQALNAIGMVWTVSDKLWRKYYAACESYQAAHGDLDVPPEYVTEDGVHLGAWLDQLRRTREVGGGEDSLSEEQIQLLDGLGMVWLRRAASRWERGYEAAAAYRAAHGDLNVPPTYKTPEGFALGRWLLYQREKQTLTENQRARLTALGMVWEKRDAWEVRFQMAQAYVQRHGGLQIPVGYVENGIWLGKWLDEQRQIYRGKRKGKRLTPTQIQRLEQLGMDWQGQQSEAWNAQYAEVLAYFQRHGDLRLPGGYKASNGKRLDTWLQRQITALKSGRLTAAQAEKLARLGIAREENTSGLPESRREGGKSEHLSMPARLSD